MKRLFTLLAACLGTILVWLRIANTKQRELELLAQARNLLTPPWDPSWTPGAPMWEAAREKFLREAGGA